MTNREKILSEMEALDGEDLYKALGKADLGNRLCENKCRDCEAMRGGHCEDDDDADDRCPSWGEWMNYDCRAERILMPEEWD